MRAAGGRCCIGGPSRCPTIPARCYYLKTENLFVNVFLDWTKSSASYLENATAVYGARTDGSRVSLHERVVFSAAWHAAEVLPNIPNSPSPFRNHLAGKIVLDIWGGHFDDIARHLKTLHDYGLDNCIAIIHDWQRSGYDNALPAHVPANANLGGDAGMKNLVTTAKSLGYDIALHENYVDYYPNYEGFNVSDVSLDSHSNLVQAWFNPGTKIQSFAVQPHAILPLAREQSSQIHDRYSAQRRLSGRAFRSAALVSRGLSRQCGGCRHISAGKRCTPPVVGVRACQLRWAGPGRRCQSLVLERIARRRRSPIWHRLARQCGPDRTLNGGLRPLENSSVTIQSRYGLLRTLVERSQLG